MVSQVDTNSALYIGTVYDITYTSVKPLKEIKEIHCVARKGIDSFCLSL